MQRAGLAIALVCLVAALAGLAYGVKLERDALAARDAAVSEGVTLPARVVGSLTSKQRRTRVGFVVDEVERSVTVFPNRAYSEGTKIDVAYRPGAPEQIFIVGATPWNWWTAMRRLFVVAAVIAGVVAVGAAVSAQPRRTSSA